MSYKCQCCGFKSSKIKENNEGISLCNDCFENTIDGFHVKDVGSGIESYIENHCLICGWIGSKHYAHNDYKFSNSKEERSKHKKRCKRRVM